MAWSMGLAWKSWLAQLQNICSKKLTFTNIKNYVLKAMNKHIQEYIEIKPSNFEILQCVR